MLLKTKAHLTNTTLLRFQALGSFENLDKMTYYQEKRTYSHKHILPTVLRGTQIKTNALKEYVHSKAIGRVSRDPKRQYSEDR